MVALGNDFSIPVTLFNLAGPPGTPVDEGILEVVGELPIAPLVAAFMFLSAFFHFLVAAPIGFGRYRSELANERNRFRWVEYSLSSTLMIVRRMV